MSKEKLLAKGEEKKEYAEFMEETLQRMEQLPVEGICIAIKLSGGAVYADYYNSNMMDKFIYAGVIQQNANMDVLKANKWIRDEENER